MSYSTLNTRQEPDGSLTLTYRGERVGVAFWDIDGDPHGWWVRIDNGREFGPDSATELADQLAQCGYRLGEEDIAEMF